MNQATQQIPSNPALDFANAVLAETDNAREIIDMLHDIAQGIHEDATDHDCISASRILLDRGLGKCPKQPPAANPNPNPTPETDDCPEPAEEGRGACPERSRRVTQLDDSLHQSLGPVPSAETPGTHSPLHSPLPVDPFSIQSDIQKYILEITNNGLTIISALTDIYRAYDNPEDYPERRGKVKHYHRVTAGRMLLDRVLGIYPTLVLGQVERSDLSDVDGAHTPSDSTDEETVPDPKWLETLAEIKRMEDEGILTPDPNAPKYDFSNYLKITDEEIAPYAAEAAAKLRADIELRYERQKQWPEIEERRRQKLAQIYPSHSDGEQPDT